MEDTQLSSRDALFRERRRAALETQSQLQNSPNSNAAVFAREVRQKFPQQAQQLGMGEAAAVAGGLSGAMQAGSSLAGTVISGGFDLLGKVVSGNASRDVADTQYDLGKYTADKQLEGTKYTTDAATHNFTQYLSQQYNMWDRDYTVANKMGLYHPSQIGQLGSPASTDIYKLGVGSVARMPKTFKRSMFSI